MTFPGSVPERSAGSVPERSAGSGPHDLELVMAAQGGDVGALDALLRRHYPRLATLCLRLTDNAADADDACQEAMVALARGLARFDGRSSFATWAYRVTTNTCLDELRRRRRRPVPGLPEDAASQPGTGSGGPDDAGETATNRVDIDRALACLAPEFRHAVVLRDLCGLSYSEIAEVVEAPIGTVRSRIARGRALLLPLLATAGTPLGHATGTPYEPGAGNPTALSERQIP